MERLLLDLREGKERFNVVLIVGIERSWWFWEILRSKSIGFGRWIY